MFRLLISDIVLPYTNARKLRNPVCASPPLSSSLVKADTILSINTKSLHVEQLVRVKAMRGYMKILGERLSGMPHMNHTRRLLALLSYCFEKCLEEDPENMLTPTHIIQVSSLSSPSLFPSFPPHLCY